MQHFVSTGYCKELISFEILNEGKIIMMSLCAFSINVTSSHLKKKYVVSLDLTQFGNDI